MKKSSMQYKIMIVLFLAPAVLSYLLIFLYPTIRTLFMSFYNAKGITDPVSAWQFVGFGNYIELSKAELFIRSLWNIFKIWFIGGILTFFFAFLFSIILHAKPRGKAFWRAVIYLPNVINAIAIATMWNLYIYNPKYGMLTQFFSKLGLDNLAKIQWTSQEHIFMAMLIAYSFGSVGYYLLIILSGMERIPGEFYEAAKLEGANIFVQFRRITMPLLKSVMTTCLIFWTTTSIGFFIWSQMFSSFISDVNTVTPVVYMYNYAFGKGFSDASQINAGLAAAVGSILCIITVIVFAIINLMNRGEKYEY